ncbi:MAG: hypothetical protein WC558_13490 [Patulibacter sp.]
MSGEHGRLPTEHDPQLPILLELERLIQAAAVADGRRVVGGRRPGQEGPRRPRDQLPRSEDAKRRR